ncbi:MAG: hypothetical protein WD182_08200 [Bacteroidota bacterium]
MPEKPERGKKWRRMKKPADHAGFGKTKREKVRQAKWLSCKFYTSR